jgi:hypothetical protein
MIKRTKTERGRRLKVLRVLVSWLHLLLNHAACGWCAAIILVVKVLQLQPGLILILQGTVCTRE